MVVNKWYRIAMKWFGVLVVRILQWAGYSVRKTPEQERADLALHSLRLIRLLAESSKTSSLKLQEVVHILDKSRSQLGQDIIALSRVGTSDPGFFVEFGATNGLDLSNTYLLEDSFGWKGILCEPAIAWHKELKSNRLAAIDTRCVYSVSGKQLNFTEGSNKELSGITAFAVADERISRDKKSVSYQVETVSLRDLLRTYDAPAHIDFLSIDTEGSEFEILKDFAFEEYSFGFICVEHNRTHIRGKLNQLLIKNGYYQIHSELSQWDDWYVRGPSREQKV